MPSNKNDPQSTDIVLTSSKNDHSGPDVSPLDALRRIMGDDEDSPFEERFFLRLSVFSSKFREPAKTREQIIADAQATLKPSFKDHGRRYALMVLFCNEIEEVMSHRSAEHLLEITWHDKTKPVSEIKLSKISVAKWSKKHAHVEIPEWDAVLPITRYLEEINPKANVSIIGWQGVEVKIYARNRIGYSINGSFVKSMHFGDIGLLHKKTLRLKSTGKILVSLCEGAKFPPQPLKNKYSAAITHLRNALKKLTGISEDPFLPYNQADGFKPKFKLIDDRRNADNRAKNQAVHISSDLLNSDDENYPTPQFEYEDDEAGQFIKKKG